MCLLTNFFQILFSINIFSRYLFKFTADLKGTTRGVFISRFCTIKSLAPVIVVEDFFQRYYVCNWKSKFKPKKILNIKVCVGFCRTTMKLMGGNFFCSSISSLFWSLFPIPGSSRIVRNNASDLLSRRDLSIKLLSCNVFGNVFYLSLFYFCLILSYFVPQCLI